MGAVGVRRWAAYGTLTTGEAAMEATVGDQIRIHGSIVGHPDKDGEIVEVRGTRGEPPYLVRFTDGQTRLLFPGPDAIIIPRQRTDSGS
jgi:hypothetical protein